MATKATKATKTTKTTKATKTTTIADDTKDATAVPVMHMRGQRTRTVWLWAPVVAYMAAIFLVSGDPDPPMPDGVSDKSLHVAAYAGLAVLAFRAVARGLPARVTQRTALAALLIASGYGVTDELHQSFVPGRSADVYDVLADSAGAVLGLIGCWAWDILGTPKSQIPNPKSQH